ncbi:MAG: tetratricopeptide repeat protein [Thermoanaerobaculum sp.]
MTPKERIAELRRDLVANPASRQFYQLGELLRREGELAEAVSVLRQGLAHHPRYVAAWVSLGRALLDLHELAEARSSFRQALDLDPQNPVAWRLLGEALLGLGERNAALHAFEQALALVPGDEVLAEAVATLRAELASFAAPPAEELAPAEEPFLAAPKASPADTASAAGPSEPFAELLPPPPPGGADLFPLENLEPPLALADAVFAIPLEPPPPPPAQELMPPPALEPLEGGEQAEAPTPAPTLAPEAAAEVFGPEPQGEPGAVVAEGFARPAAPEAEAAMPAGPPAAPPTLAEARAAVHRGELALAAEILERLVEREPENQEAADLLALVRDMLEPLPADEPKLSAREKKIAALQRFLANVTLARERLRV